MSNPTNSPSFAAQYADPAMGFTAVPRWFHRGEFWKSLPAAHRAILFELYARMARKPVTHKRTGIKLDRGQWATSWGDLANASGATVQQVRTALAKAEKAGIIQQAVSHFRTARVTQHISVFTWVEFETYDQTNVTPNRTPNVTPNVRHNALLNTRIEDPTGKPVGEEIAASPLGGLTATPSDGPGSGASGNAGTAELPPVGQERPAKRSRSSAKSTARGSVGRGLSDEDKVAICASPDTMTAYWLYGPAAVGRPAAEWAGLTPSATHWAPSGGDVSAPEAGAGDAALAAWAWVQLCHTRKRVGLPPVLPTLGRLIGAVRGLRKRMTHAQLIAHVRCVADRWTEIQTPLGRWGAGLVPDEQILDQPQVVAQSERLRAGLSPAGVNGNNINTNTEGRYANLF